MKNLSKLAFVLTLAAPAVASAGGITGGARVDLVPLGSIHFEADGGNSDDSDMVFAYGFAGQVDYWVTEQISVGLAPRFLLNVNTKDGDDAGADPASQLDIPVRAAYNHTVNEQIQAFGFASLGFSVIMPPSDSDADNATGLVIGVGAGGRYAINDKVFATAELGYDIGFQGSTVDILGTSVDVTTAPRFLHIGVGAGAHF